MGNFVYLYLCYSDCVLCCCWIHVFMFAFLCVSFVGSSVSICVYLINAPHVVFCVSVFDISFCLLLFRYILWCTRLLSVCMFSCAFLSVGCDCIFRCVCVPCFFISCLYCIFLLSEFARWILFVFLFYFASLCLAVVVHISPHLYVLLCVWLCVSDCVHVAACTLVYVDMYPLACNFVILCILVCVCLCLCVILRLFIVCVYV